MFENYPDVLEVRDVCALLRIGRLAVYDLLKSGQLEYKQIGRVYKIRKDAVIEFLKNK